MTGPAIGVDLGGTKIEIVTLEADGTTRGKRRTPTPRDDYDATVRAVKELVAAAESDLGVPATVGVGHPGSLSPRTGRVRNANSTWLNDRSFGRDLEAALARPVACANDADCLALSEATDGAGAGAAVVFAVIVGTGTGGGLVVDGHLLRGANGIAGEWGHNPLPWPDEHEWPGPPCWCGKRGCIETWLSGTGLAREAEAALGRPVRGEALTAAADAGEAGAEAVIAAYVERFAKATATVLDLLDPDVVVVGGGVSGLGALYREVPARWADWVFADAVATRLEPARHGDSSGVRGAAWLGRDAALTRSAAGSTARSG
ncbi:MAG: ROK family protein [Alphaproteobacteria bacterium]|jgi:fructokinase|nr:ROK family protein [Alphaproteobacteria bacterium]